MEPGRALLVANLALALLLAGLIWTIQVVHYPLFARVGAGAFAAYHAAHSARITALVGPLMGAEALAALALLVAPPAGLARWVPPASAACVGLAWGVTALLAVPLHGRLAAGLDPALVDDLVRVNGLRTFAWTARAALLAWPLLAR
jgi:hypothetical protein